MHDVRATRGTLRIALLAAALLAAAQAGAQTAPTNDAPNPYQAIEGWAKMPAG